MGKINVITATIVIFVLVILALLIVSPYIKSEYLTFKYGHEFNGLELQTNMLDSYKYFKVLEYSEQEAIVFYVSDTGDVITFSKENSEQWSMQEWRTIWSNSGSADSFFWPYYR